MINLNKYDTYIIDDLRLLEHVEYKNILSQKYKIKIIRIYSDES